ncbi:MAG: hypothetical protein JWM55_476 [Acidimicrobiaceae bacterium]|nr:hypothetical protein [Acidimicrobiaceae bacterium]
MTLVGKCRDATTGTAVVVRHSKKMSFTLNVRRTESAKAPDDDVVGSVGRGRIERLIFNDVSLDYVEHIDERAIRSSKLDSGGHDRVGFRAAIDSGHNGLTTISFER